MNTATLCVPYTNSMKDRLFYVFLLFDFILQKTPGLYLATVNFLEPCSELNIYHILQFVLIQDHQSSVVHLVIKGDNV